MKKYRYRANITYHPSDVEGYPGECVWNVAIYDATKEEDGGYVWSYGATDLQDAIAVAYEQFADYGQEVLA